MPRMCGCVSRDIVGAVPYKDILAEAIYESVVSGF